MIDSGTHNRRTKSICQFSFRFLSHIAKHEKLSFLVGLKVLRQKSSSSKIQGDFKE